MGMDGALMKETSQSSLAPPTMREHNEKGNLEESHYQNLTRLAP